MHPRNEGIQYIPTEFSSEIELAFYGEYQNITQSHANKLVSKPYFFSPEKYVFDSWAEGITLENDQDWGASYLLLWLLTFLQ